MVLLKVGVVLPLLWGMREKGFATLSEVGQRAGNRSSFDVRSYGYKRLSDLVEAIPDFTVERREGRIYVRRGQ